MKWYCNDEPVGKAYVGDNQVYPDFKDSSLTLPENFVFNYNAKLYDTATRTIAHLEDALETEDFILGAFPVSVGSDYLEIDSSSNNSMKAQISSGKTQYYSIDGTNNSEATWIFKYSRSGSDGNCHFLSNRDGAYNWMVRTYVSTIKVHDSTERNACPVSTYPCTAVIRIADDGTTTIQDLTDDTACVPYTFSYGRTNATPTFFAGYYSTGGEWFTGRFYWAFFINRCLTDDEVQQVIYYNENI